MSIVDVIDKNLFNETVTWYPFASRDQFGAPTFSASGTQYRARVTRKHRLVRDAQGDLASSTALATILGAPEIAMVDKVVLDSDGSDPEILSVERYGEASGPSFTRVFFR